MAPRHQVLDPHVTDRQVQRAHRVELGAAEMDLRDARGRDGLQRGAAEREHAGHGDRIEVRDGVDDVAAVLRLELQ